MKWRVILETDLETGDWAVWCPELPGCVSAGETEEEALENIREAIALYLEPDPIVLKAGTIGSSVLTMLFEQRGRGAEEKRNKNVLK